MMSGEDSMTEACHRAFEDGIEAAKGVLVDKLHEWADSTKHTWADEGAHEALFGYEGDDYATVEAAARKAWLDGAQTVIDGTEPSSPTA
ncbi:MAG: hypothetical protein ABI595_06350 [Actinomycetota bacterium]